MPPEPHDPRDIPILTEKLVDRILREHAATQENPKDHG
jgi:hypothetical protein